MLCGLGMFAHAQLGQSTVTTIETVHVFPEQVTAVGWKNVESVVVQNLDEFALYQEFNKINSSYPDSDFFKKEIATQEKNPDTESESAETPEPVAVPQDIEVEKETEQSEVAASTSEAPAVVSDDTEVQATTTTEQVAEPVAAGTTDAVSDTDAEDTDTAETPAADDTAPVADTDALEVAEDEEPEAETETPAASDEQDTVDAPVAYTPVPFTSVFAALIDPMPFVSTATTVPFIDISQESVAYIEADAEVVEDVVLVDSTVETEVPVDASEDTPDTSVGTVPMATTTSSEADTIPTVTTETPHEEVVATSTIPTASEPSEAATTTESVVADVDTPHATTTTATATPVHGSVAEEVYASTTVSCDGACAFSSITLSGFGLPIFDEERALRGAQLRMSFAAQRKETRDVIQNMHVRYSFDDGATWIPGGDVFIQEDASNSLNGGYFLFALPQIADPALLDNLTVELVYRDNPAVLTGLFVDAVWLEVFTVSETVDPLLSVQELLKDNGFDAQPLSGDVLVLDDGTALQFDTTDENEDETLIIKSNDLIYEGLTKTTTYFNVTNTSNTKDTFTLQTYFPEDVGTVLALEEWNQNKEKEIVVPEYRPYIYHCEAGWERSDGSVESTLEDLSHALIEAVAETEADTTTSTPASDAATTTEAIDVAESLTAATTTDDAPVPAPLDTDADDIDVPHSATTEIEAPVPDAVPLLQANLSLVSSATTTDDATATMDEAHPADEEIPAYVCRNTTIVRQCDVIEGDNTTCRVNNMKVATHEVTRYYGGWEESAITAGAVEKDTGVLHKVKQFFGFAARTKAVPDVFEARSYSETTYTIEPGETKYFKMDIEFPPLSRGEFWVEAIGAREYGLLDPFWSSEWKYRLPVMLDNTLGSDTLTDHQVRFTIPSTATDFWSNVNADGSDVRFVQEVPGTSDDTWYDTSWNTRMAITVQASEVDATLNNFPVYVDLATLGAEFFDAVRSDGGDIRVTAADGVTEVPYELVAIDTSAETGELHFQASSIASSVDTVFYIYYDNEGALGYARTDTYGSEQVWDSNYLGVYHLVETSAGVAGEFKDSTSNAHDGVGENTLPTPTTGFMGVGQNMQSGHIDLGAASRWTDIGTNDEFNLSAWINLDNSSSDYAIVSQWSGGGAGVLLWADAGGSGDGFCLYGGNYAPSDCQDQNDQSPGTWQHIVARYDSIDWSLYIDGAISGSGAVSQSLTQQPVGFSIGSVQADDNTHAFDGRMDEIRISSIDRGENWLESEYTNQSAPTTFYATSTPDELVTTQYSELDFWIQHFSTTTNEADVWVQVDTLAAGASTTIYLYYGNEDATMGSDAFSPFTYDTLTPTYYVLDDIATGPIQVYSYIDNNQVRIDDGTPVSLDAGEMTSFSTYSGSSTISALGPIAATIDAAAADSITPVAFASTTQAGPTNRNTSQWFVLSPFASSSVQTYIANSGTPDENFSVAAGTVVTSNTDAGGGQSVILESSDPILVYHRESGSRDSFVLYPPTTDDLYGIDSNSVYVTALADDPDPTVYCSSGSSATVTGVTRGERQNVSICVAAGEGVGDAVRFTGASTPFAAIQQADSDGSESTTFWPEYEFGTTYYIPTDMAYAAIVCAPRYGTTTLEIQPNGGGSALESATCVPGANIPGKAYFDNGRGGDTLAYAAGHMIVSTNDVPFYVIYEDDEEDNDETNILTNVQGRKFTKTPITAAFGAQEIIIDAEYTQHSFGWYENTDAETVTDAWSLGEGAYATEGVHITGQGAVNDDDVLRLRINALASAATGTATSSAFKLQYAVSDTCAVSSTSWHDVGAIGSTTAHFTGYDNASVSDGATLASTTLASSTVFATYEEENLSSRNPVDINPGAYAEWDWVIQSANASVNTNYCFRMVREGGQPLVSYTTYPELYTAGPPLQATTLVYFDNEHTADLDSVLDFTAVDAAGDDINYQVQIDTDPSFGSPVVDRNSLTNFLEFENINTPSDKAPFTSGNRIRFTSPTTLTASTTYWWRVRGRDPDGSNTYGTWSVPSSFTTNGAIVVSEWHQTTGHQFDTDTLVNLATSTGAVSLTSSPAVLTTSAIDFDDATVGNAWGAVTWSDTETSGTILYQIEYYDGTSWALVPDSALANNSIGNGTAPLNILGLDTDTYNQIRIVATLTGATLSIEDLTVQWGQRVNTPTLLDPFDNEKIADTTPEFTFTTTDPQLDDLVYEVSYSTDYIFVSSTTVNSSTTPADFANVSTPLDTNPYNSGDTIRYTIPGGAALTNGETYWWRVRAKDPAGGDAWSPWSDADALTVDTSVTVSTWFQTTQAQFAQGELDGLVASTSGSVGLNTEIGEYGKVIVDAEDWTTVNTTGSYNTPVVVASLRYAPQGETQRAVRVRNKTETSFEIKADDPNGVLTGTTTVDYLVMEAGDWTMADGAGGTRVIAGTFSEVSDVQGGGSYAGSGYGEDVAFSPPFASAPAIVATVSTENDASWVVAHLNDGNTRSNPPDASNMGIYLGRSALSAVHDPEDVDYIAIESGHGTNNGGEFDADVGSDSHNEPPVTAEAYNTAFSVAPEVIIVMQAAEQDGNGAWFSVYEDTAPTAANYYPVSDEAGDRNHTPEPVFAISFENASGVLVREASSGGGLSGTIYSEPIYFSDGAGPKFEEFLWSDSTPGTSTIRYQLEYLAGGSTWTLIPDTDLAGNSVGTTTAPVDLTGLDVVTYDTIRIVGTLACANGTCPELHDWTIAWSEGVTVSGTAQEYDRATAVTSGTVRIAVNGVLSANTGTIAGGTWSINNITAFAGDVITVFVDGAAEAQEAVNVFVYDGIGDMTGVALYEQHLALDADETATTTLAHLSTYDNSVSGDEDIFFDVDGLGDLTLCTAGACSRINLYIGAGNSFVPATSTAETLRVHDYVNDGFVALDGNTLEVSGSWENNANTQIDTSTVIFTASSTVETLADVSGTLSFNNLTFGNAASTAQWQSAYPYSIAGDLSVQYGTLDRASSTITVSGDITTGAAGIWSGVATTTFAGTAPAQWTDATTLGQDIGHVVIDGPALTVAAQSNVRASSIIIGADDTFDAGGTYTIAVLGDVTNNNIFTPRTSTLALVGASSVVTMNNSSLYTVHASATMSVAFTDTNIVVLDNFQIATGTVTLPTGTTTIGGSFSNIGGNFAHNNGAVDMVSTGAETIAQQGTNFLNAFYNLSFTGSGSWSFVDTAATTTNDFIITDGAVTLPSSQLTVGGAYRTEGSGSFAHNTGEVVLLVTASDAVTTNGSAFEDVRIRNAASGAWYDFDWTSRKAITIDASVIDATLTNFPVYVDLADLGSDFFTEVNADGGDIRITQSDGVTEVAREVVAINTGAETGELHFNATSIASTTDTTFYIYYGNSGASEPAASATYGSENTWNSNYEAVYHLSESGSTYSDSTSNGHDGTGEGTNPTVTTGVLGDGQDIASGRIDLGNGMNTDLISAGAYAVSVWVNLDTSASDQSPVSQYTAAGDLLFWADAGGGGTGFCHYNGTYMPSDCKDLNNQNVSTWQYLVARHDGSVGSVYVDGQITGVGDTSSTFAVDAGVRFSIGTQNGDSTARQFNGQVDEVRIVSSALSAEWIAAEYQNQATTTDFYTIAASEDVFARTFTEAAATVLGDITIESGEVVFPSGVLSVGGSFDNDGTFAANNGTVLFNSAAGSETIAAGVSSFATVQFNHAAGDFTITEHATATDALALVDAASFTVNSGLVLASQGAFTNTVGGASTTWTGTTLKLSSGGDVPINTTADAGDTYATLLTTGDTSVSMWNSAAGTYTTMDTASIYSQDHAGVDGDLYIFGTYTRDSGTEYWSYATDFDGTDLGTTSPRAVSVHVENGASVTIATSSFEMRGVAGASTTVDAQSGSFAITAAHATVTAEYFTMTGTDADGLALTSSTTVTTFDRFMFTIGAGVSAVTVDASTIDTNPAAQFFETGFVSGGGSANVTLSGSPTSFWWFRDGAGDRYGEAFDNADGNPGALRWDDSNYTIDISGTVYADDGTTTLGGPTCDGVTNVVRVVVDGGTYTDSVPCSDASGAYTLSNVAYVGDADLVVYLDTNGGVLGSVYTKTPTGNITDLNIYAHRVMTRHEDTAAMTIADMVHYDEDDDSDLRVSTATGSPDTVIVRADTELIIASSTTFAPSGTVTVESGGSGMAYDGSFHIDDNATFTASGTETHRVGGSFFRDTGSSFDAASTTFIFTATTSGKAITSVVSGDTAFHAVQFTGVGGAWNLNTDIALTADLTLATGTLTGTGNITLTQGAFTGDGSLSLGGGTVSIAEGSVLGGVNPWTFHNITLGTGTTYGTTTRASLATTTVGGVLTVTAGHVLDMGGSHWELAGAGTPLVLTGTLDTATSTVRYSASAATNIVSGAYYNLLLSASGNAPTYTAIGPGITVGNALTIGGATTTNVTFTTNDTALDVAGDMTIATTGVFVASDSGSFTLAGSYDNNGTFTAGDGTVTFDGVGSATVAAGSSAFATVLLTGTGDYTFSEYASATEAFSIGSSVGSFTLASGETLAVGGTFTNALGGASTTWSGSTLELAGGSNYAINAKTIADRYDTLVVADGTQIRMWNSSATTTMVLDTSSLYSMDHAGVDGAVYVYGTYTKTAGTDYWSYATDFDGTDLSGGDERAASVYFAEYSTTTYTGGGLQVLGTASATTTLQKQPPLASGVTIVDGFTSGTTKTISAGINRLLVVGIFAEDSATNADIDTVTYGGETMTEIHDEQITTVFTNAVWVGYLDETGMSAAIGNTISPTWVGGTPDSSVLYSSVVLGHVDQVNPISGWSADSAASVATLQATSSLSVADGDRTLYFTGVGSGGVTHTPSSGYTEGTEEDDTSAVAATAHRAITGSGTEYPTATWSSAVNHVVMLSLNVRFATPLASTYGLRIGGTASTTWSYYSIREIDADGLTFSGTPNVTSLSYGDFLVAHDGGSALTIGGTVINENPAKNFVANTFATSSTFATAYNVTATGTAISSWRFVSHVGDLAGESYDNDLGGDPGYVVWDDSAANITISGNVYSDEGSTVSSVCDGATNNITLRVAGLTSYTTSCNATTGFYQITGVAYGPTDTLTLYIDNEPENAANVTVAPVSSIGDMHLYENRVIVRHENTDPLTIADMSVWDDSDDGDIPFTAVDGGTDTLTLPADYKLIVWNNKTFAPAGNITLAGGGAGAAYDGTLALFADAQFAAADGENHSIGGSMVMDADAVFDAQESTMTFTTTAAARTIDTNEQPFYKLTFNGTGSWSIANTDLAVDSDLSITQGTLTLPSGTTTISGSMNASGGSFAHNNGVVVFDSAGTGEVLLTGGSAFNELIFTGDGSWNMNDTHATATDRVRIANGAVRFPSGSMAIGADLTVHATGTLMHNNGAVWLTSTAPTTTVTLTGSDLYTLVANGDSELVFADTNVALQGDLTLLQGTTTAATGTLSIGGSFQNDASFSHASGTLYFNSGDTGETVSVGGDALHNVLFASAGGGWTMVTSATTTGNFSLTNATGYVQTSGTTLTVAGVFTNTVGGAATTWTNTTLRLTSGTDYAINTKAAGGDSYATIALADEMDVRSWNSSYTTVTLATSSLYSQDHASVDGDLYIYGDFTLATGTAYWSYATDFDGTVLTGGSRRAVDVFIASGSTVSVDGGSLYMVGDATATTTVQGVSGYTYPFSVASGLFDAQYYAFRNLNASGLHFADTPTINALSYGDFVLDVSGGSLITLSSTTLNANASMVIPGVRFATTSAISGVNVTLLGTTTNAWQFIGHSGNISGEAYDSDDGTNCGSIRWDDSSCLLTQQTGYRWRTDDGGLGVPDDEWLDTDWSKRRQIRVRNDDATTYTNMPVRVEVSYDSDMQTDFEDVRFTDAAGTTELSYWVERYTASTDATVWVLAPSLAASDITTIYMYYGNALATSSASGTAVFNAFDDFEDNDIAEYSGDTTLFQTDTTFNYNGNFGLEASDTNEKTDNGLYDTTDVAGQGEIIRYLQYIDTSAGSGDETCTYFGVQGMGSNYGICLALFGIDRMALVEDVEFNDSSGTVLASTTVSFVTGWHEVEIDWQTSGTMDVTLSRSGSVVATTSATDSTYTSGGIGFGFWFQNGGWDSYTSRPRMQTAPTVWIGDESVAGGASWAAAQDTEVTTLSIGDTARVRFLIENTGLDITNQNFEIEYAAKGTAPSCEAVAGNTYTAVPTQASCGANAICMSTSTHVVNLAATADLLTGAAGDFTAGQFVEDASTQTSNLDVLTDEFTELEYALTPTSNAIDSSYCFRVTNAGTDLDAYISVAGMVLRFDPVITALSLNNGDDIVLSPGATTTVYATGTVTDLNGFADLDVATATIYRSGVGETCTEDANDCYRAGNASCTLNSCGGTACALECSVDMYYFADPTDIGTYAGETWRAFAEIADVSGSTATATAPSIDLLTLRAITVDDSIAYGALAPSSDTGAVNASTTVENIGNDNIDISISGTNLTDGATSEIPVSEQRFATSTFTYASCVICSTLSTTSSSYEVDLWKPTTTTPGVTDEIYWGINIPFGVAGTAHSGENTFSAIAD